MISERDCARLFREIAASWMEVLAPSGGVLERTEAGRWSTLEYGCHVRDVLRLADERILLMVEQDNPTFENWDQDATAVADDYATQNPEVVAVELASAAERVAAGLEELHEAEWPRQATRSDGAAFTLATFARHLVHDPVHHLADVVMRTS